MNKFDKYYLKKGKLELSILDEEDDEEFSPPKKGRDKEVKLKINKDISNTLQKLSQYLSKEDTEKDNQEADERAKELERIASSVTLQDVTVSNFEPSQNKNTKEAAMPQEEVQYTDEEEIVEDVLDATENMQDETLIEENHVDEAEDSSNQNFVENYENEEDMIYDVSEEMPTQSNEQDSSQEQLQDNKQDNSQEQLQDDYVYLEDIEEEPVVEDNLESNETFKEVTGLERFKCVVPIGENLDLEVKEIYDEAAKEVEDLYGKKDFAAPIEMKSSQHKRTDKKQARGIFEDEQRMTDALLEQDSIDEILGEHFGRVTPRYEYAQELRRKINKKIESINNYEAN